MSSTNQKDKAPNDIRIGGKSRTKYVIQYASGILKEKDLKELKFSAVGNSIQTLIDVVEIMKTNIPGFYQQNKIGSVVYQRVDPNKKVIGEKILPKMEVTLSLDKFKEENEGTQDKYDEDFRKKIETIFNKMKEERAKNRESGRGRGRGRGRGFRGRRGFRGGRRFENRGRGIRGRGRGSRGTRGRGAPERGARGTRGTPSRGK